MSAPPCETCLIILFNAACGHNEWFKEDAIGFCHHILKRKLTATDSGCLNGCNARRTMLYTHWQLEHAEELSLLMILMSNQDGD
jgi:hypothetical protein